MPCSQVTRSKTSAKPEGTYKTWEIERTEKGFSTASELEDILKTIWTEGDQMEQDCQGCKLGDTHCNCSVTALRENEYTVDILLHTEDGPKWCPPATVDTNTFACTQGSFTKIRSLQVCDGFPDCPGGQDEAKILCQSLSLKIAILVVVLFVYALAFSLVVCYSYRADKGRSQKTENRCYRKKQEKKINLHLRDIRKMSVVDEQLIGNELRQLTKKMQKKTQLHLLVVADNLPKAGKKSTLLKPIVQAVIPEDEKSQKKVLIAVKNLPISDRLKNRVFSTHANGALTRLKSYCLDKIPNKAKNRLHLVANISSEIKNLGTPALQVIKDLGVIATIYFFYNEVLQERPWLIDGINLYDYVALLSGILAFTFFLRLLRTSTTLSKREKEEIHPVA